MKLTHRRHELFPGFALTVATSLFLSRIVSAAPPQVILVIHISMDGLRPDAITALGPTNLPNFYRLRNEGAFTDNARSDYDHTVTLPNHICQLTGRGVEGPSGHNWTGNDDPAPEETLASNKGSYIAGVFDVAHDHGLRTGLYASKTKFSLFAISWNETNGAPDVIGPDNGRNKIDVFSLNTDDTAELVNTLVADVSAQPSGYVFLHLKDPDSAGHGSGWDPTPGSVYSDTIKTMDDRLGSIFNLIDNHPQLTGRTAIILTADHGGGLDYDHSDPSLPENYTIPFYVWGSGVMGGADLYALNQATRLNPDTNRPAYSEPIQPIHNGDAANVALKLLGLEPVTNSTLNAAQDLALTVPPPDDFRMAMNSPNAVLHFTAIANVLYDLQYCDDLNAGSWSNQFANILGCGTATNINAGSILSKRFYRLRLHF